MYGTYCTWPQCLTYMKLKPESLTIIQLSWFAMEDGRIGAIRKVSWWPTGLCFHIWFTCKGTFPHYMVYGPRRRANGSISWPVYEGEFPMRPLQELVNSREGVSRTISLFQGQRCPIQLSAVVDMFCILPSTTVAMRLMWLLSTCNVTRASAKLHIYFYLIVINLNMVN